jgi:23S rRNA (cytidine1920-2'-O)/16S rRNA (cytidine1409-2'-O)-methyltransferase
MTKKRLDALVAELYPQLSRNHIQSLVMQGKVRVNDQVLSKPGTPTPDDAKIEVLLEEQKYVGRAGFKMEAALKEFGVDVKDKVALDAGISTGGFTDCLLQNGAKRVYGVDVGFGQVHEKVSRDPRLILMEKTNLRHLDKLPEQVDLVTLDLSFISLLKVMPAVIKLIKPDGKIIALIKPQFEAEREDVGKNGLIKDAAVHKKVVEKIRTGMLGYGFEMKQVIESPIKGAASGNIEFLALLERKC